MHTEYQPELTLHIVDDDQGVRESMVTLFTAHGLRVQAHGSGEAFLQQAALHRPDCVLLDLRMQGMTGLQVLQALQQQASPLVVVFLSGHGDIPTAMEATHRGAFDWLVKGMPETELLAKVDAAMERAAERARLLHRRSEVAARWNTLTPREKDVARLVRNGWSNKLVADELQIGVRVVEGYRAKVFDKLWVSNPTELDRLLRDHPIA
jgi:FixJ family two-component response regulator